jgi:hypothetical protein
MINLRFYFPTTDDALEASFASLPIALAMIEWARSSPTKAVNRESHPISDWRWETGSIATAADELERLDIVIGAGFIGLFSFCLTLRHEGSSWMPEIDQILSKN